MATKKHPRRTTVCGEVTVKRSLEDIRDLLGADAGSESLPVKTVDGPLAEATGVVALTIPTDVEYKVLRIECGGRLPCSVEAFVSGKAHRVLHNILRREFNEQYKRGTKGLEKK